MNISARLVPLTPVPPPPSMVRVELDLTIQEAKLLRAMLGNASRNTHGNSVASAMESIPVDNTNAATHEQAHGLAMHIAGVLIDVLKGN